MKFQVALALLNLIVSGAVYSADCSSEKLEELFSPPTAKSSKVILNCSIKLDPSRAVEREVRFLGPEGSNSILDCQGALLKRGVRVSSKRVVMEDGKIKWLRPENITIRNCNIKEGIRVSGIKEIGVINHPEMIASSRLPGHTIRAQAAAPMNIKVENSIIEATGGAPIYIDGGTVGFSLINSTVNGFSNVDGVYLDAESSSHVFSGNTFNLDVGRVIIAIDGSAKNKIINNKFAGKRYAGIWVFRNCGEKGLVRHQTPFDNLISSNIFLPTAGQIDPDIWIGSRNKFFDEESFCWQDKKLDHIANVSDLFDLSFKQLPIKTQKLILDAENYEVGSSKYNLDMAKNNIVTNNVTSLPIRVSSPDNIIRDNEAPRIIRGPYYKECNVQGSNEGCFTKFTCPKGTRIHAVKAACNLETPTISKMALYEMGKESKIKIVRSSLTKEGSLCSVNDISLNEGEMSLSSLVGQDILRLSCKETEKNGGDCAVKAEVYCEE